MDSKKYIEIYTDGACSGNPGKGGWGVYIKIEDQEIELNGSIDNTQEVLNELRIDSIKQANLGSAGGWNTGLKYALKYGFDAAWLMDDDGYPDKNAYQILQNSFTKNMSCISSVLINEFDKSKFVFPYPLFNKKGIPRIGLNKSSISLVNQLQEFCKDDLYPWTHLFNGALISIESVKKIGYVTSETLKIKIQDKNICNIRVEELT